ncbi:hypothetical protein CHELA40_30250 [Chelatococcus asaccharovorans]|nr:hypothetical protein CHELA17_40165 [Chelatococcus asaccharovorans]CAH1688540.1 hypothetical protein CHELA40_30250 [Chelatococcus asaccharovorans]
MMVSLLVRWSRACRGLDGDGTVAGGGAAHPQGGPQDKTEETLFFGGRGMAPAPGEKTAA